MRQGTIPIVPSGVDVAGGKPVASDGISYLPTLLGKEKRQEKHEYISWEYPEKGGQLAIRMGNWKALKRDLRKNPNARWQLYDLAKDRKETTDLAVSNPASLAQFDAIVKKEHRPPHVAEWKFLE